LIVALLGEARLTKNISSISSRRSPLTGTVTVFAVSPAAKRSVPLPAV
jgi:hypothetical protein